MNTTQDLVDVNEGSRLTGLDKATLYKIARERRIRSFKVLGTALRFERADLLKLVQERPAVVPETYPPTTDRNRRVE